MMRILELKREDLKDSMLIVGLPGRGLVGSISSSYLIEELKMWPVAAVLDPRFPPTTVSRSGVAVPPVRFHVSAQACGPDGKCDKLLVLTSDIPIEPELSNELAETVLTWAREKGIRHAVTIEGVEMDDTVPKGRKGPMLRGLEGNNRELHLSLLKVPPLPDGIVTSLSSAFLNAATELKIDLVALFSGSNEDADGPAAVESLSRVDALLPNIELGAEKILEKVNEYTVEADRRTKLQVKRMKELRRVYDMMYR